MGKEEISAMNQAAVDSLSLRELQREAARAISTMLADNNSIYKFNNQAHHDSQKWYKAVILHYMEEHGGYPSKIGPGVNIKLVMDD